LLANYVCREFSGRAIFAYDKRGTESAVDLGSDLNTDSRDLRRLSCSTKRPARRRNFDEAYGTDWYVNAAAFTEETSQLLDVFSA
jgi:hypothetical protein